MLAVPERQASPDGVAGIPVDRVQELDLLRFIAAISVVFFHVALFKGAPQGLLNVTRFGSMGVHVFFMISGFVILWTATNKSAFEFAWSRITRLYPSFWVGIAITLPMLWLAFGRVPGARTIAFNLTMFPMQAGYKFLDRVYWTLFVEAKFYALVFVVLLFGMISRIESILWGWLAISVISRIAGIDPLELADFGGFAPYFIAGAFLYLIRSQGINQSRVMALAICLALSIHHVMAIKVEGGGDPTLAHRFIGAGVVLGAYAAFAMIALRKLRLPQSPWLYVLGSLTYPLYLIHNKAGGGFYYLLPEEWSSAIRVTCSILFSLVVAAIMAALIERRLCHRLYRWGKRWVTPSLPRRESATA